MKKETRLIITLVLATAGALFAGSCGGDSAGLGATCEQSADCGGRTPTCNDDGACVECTGNDQCGLDERICADGLCAECGGDDDCPADAPFCIQGDCSECRDNDDCGVAEPLCLPEGECVTACDSNAQCTSDNEICHPDLGACAECASDDDCVALGDEPLCDPIELECVECRDDDDCGAADPFCVNGSCRECLQNTDCGAGGRCDSDLECD